MRAELQIGAAKVDITPDVKALRVPLGGYADRRGAPATGVHDAVYARALVLSDGKTKVGIVSTDLCFLPANVKAEVVRLVQATGIHGLNAGTLFLAATHTHAAPDPLAMHSGNDLTAKGWTPFDAKLLGFTVDRIAEAIVTAEKRLAPAKMRTKVVQPAKALNRNRRTERTTDTDLMTLEFRDRDDHLLAMVVNYAAHPTLYGAGMKDISADWPGALTRRIEREQGGVCLFLNGAEGDASVNGAEGRNAEAQVEHYAGAMLTALQEGKALETKTAPLSAWTKTVTLPERKPNGLFLAAALQLGLTLEQAQKFVARLMPKTTVLSFARIGDVLLMGFPCEPTTPLGLAAKAIARKAGHLVPAVVALTNDWLGYALTPEQYRAGGYEAGMSFYGETLGPTLLTALETALSAGTQGRGLKTPGNKKQTSFGHKAQDYDGRP